MERSPRLGEENLSEYVVNCPVLVVAFNRPEHLAILIDQLRKQRPKIIYFAVDGAREGVLGELQLVRETRALASRFDWDCRIRTKFSEKNLGCGMGVSSAISWAFETENELIVLEDDIIPDPSFFPYCEELLDFHKGSNDVFAISGCNLVPSSLLNRDESYRFSQIPHVWGWALWKRSWDLYEFELSNWHAQLSMTELRKAVGGSWIASLMWARIFSLMEKKKIDTWDYQLVFAAIKNKSFIATSNVNLTENIGFGNDATHTTIVPQYILDRGSVSFPLKHPATLVNARVDAWTQKNCFGCSYPSVLALIVRGFLGRAKLLVTSLRNRSSAIDDDK